MNEHKKSPPKETVKVSVMRHEISVACNPDERRNLAEAAAYLDKQMRRAAKNKRAVDTERLAIIAALNISDELLQLRKTQEENALIGERLEELHRQVDDVVDGIRNAAE